MAEKTTFIKLDRNIVNWRWYKEPNTMRVFLHLLLTANIRDYDFRYDTIHRGEVAVSIGNLGKSTGLSYDQVRTALTHLKDTNEITITREATYLINNTHRINTFILCNISKVLNCKVFISYWFKFRDYFIHY